jgi:hypothetical protein
LVIFDYFVLNAEHQLDKAVADIISIIHTEHSRVHQRRIVA